MYGLQIFDYNLKPTLLFDRFNDSRNAKLALEDFLHDYFHSRGLTCDVPRSLNFSETNLHPLL